MPGCRRAMTNIISGFQCTKILSEVESALGRLLRKLRLINHIPERARHPLKSGSSLLISASSHLFPSLHVPDPKIRHLVSLS